MNHTVGQISLTFRFLLFGHQTSPKTMVSLACIYANQAMISKLTITPR